MTAHESVGDEFGRGRALVALGVTLRRALQKRAARERSTRHAPFAAMGPRGWAAKAAGELGRIGGRRRGRA